MIKYCKTNEQYFDFLDKYKDKYKILKVKVLPKSVKVVYSK